MKTNLVLAFVSITALSASAHEVDFKHLHGSTNPATPLKFVVEKKGPVAAPAPLKEKVPVTGQGFWKFAAAKDRMLPPAETTNSLKPAHGTIVVDVERDVAYWGLQSFGWVAFSNNLSQSWVVKGDPMFKSGNLHGADLLPRKGKLPLVVAADNMEGEVYVSDTTFEHAQKLDWPEGGPYKAKKEFMATDATFVDGKDVYVTDGYGKQWFMHATTDPLKFDGKFLGGREFSRTPHGITYSSDHKTLYLAARPEATIKEYEFKKDKWRESMGLPPGSTVCDVDIWDDYLLAPCLDGPKGADGKATHGPIYIVNIKTRTIVSTIRVKEDLGYEDALHIHDAAWYVRGKGKDREVYILFTNWNPGGVGAIRLVNVPDAQ
jgi:hypothetical protein